MTSYEKDFYKWTNEQAIYLRQKDFKKLDIGNLVEEIESLGRSERRALHNFIKRLFKHMLKLEYQPKKKTTSWINSIENSKDEISYILNANPSLNREVSEISIDAYKRAVREASRETKLDLEIFPEECPWNIKELLND